MLRTKESHELGQKFFDYRDDEEAERQENKLLHSLTESDYYFEDPTFPPAGESLYRTPQQPPAGALSQSLVFWGRLSRREVRGYESPITFPPGNDSVSAAVQGALGDSWLVSALNILSLSPDLLRNVVVSDRHREKGLYTLKLFKEGSWRYVHVDDRLPTSPSRVPQYCRTREPNQAWAPLIEKAAAKLYGCYENLKRGSIAEGLRCITGAPLLKAWLSLRDFGDAEGVPRQEDLFSNMKRWKEQGCPMGCYRGVKRDRVHEKTESRDSLTRTLSGKQQQGGLIPGLGYGILRICEASAPATPDQDAAKFKMVQLSCPWGIGQWRKAWGNDSDLWEQFPSIKAQLRSRVSHARPHLGSSDNGGTLEAGNGKNCGRGSIVPGDIDGLTAGNARFSADGDTQGEESSFWMSLEDFVREFSKLFICLTYAVEPINRTLSRKTYHGAWSPGDTLTGSGGGCRYASFVQNPCYPVMIQRNSTRITVCLSTFDRSWQVDPNWRGWRSRHHAVGYYILRLKGTKPRVTRFGSHKVAARPERFELGWQSTGEHVLNSGRYAFIPITVKPLTTTTGYILDIMADRSVEWEQVGDAIPPPDRELEVSDDEMDQSTVGNSEEVEAEDTQGPPGDKIAEAMNEELARVSSLIAELRGSINELGERFKLSRAAKEERKRRAHGQDEAER